MAYLPLSTANLPDPVIDPAQGSSPEDYFGTLTWTGTGGSRTIADGQSGVTGDVNFTPDFSWIKSRSLAASHTLYDVVRTTGEMLQSDGTGAEQSDSAFGYLSSFTDGGFGVTTGTDGSNPDFYTNQSSATYVAWNWKAGTSFSNDASATSIGTVDSNGSVSTESGFSIVRFNSGASGTQSFKHGLTQRPDICIFKEKDSGGSGDHWVVWEGVALNPAQSYGYLNLTNGFANDASQWSNTAPTDSIFTYNSGYAFSTSQEMIAYCFHSIEGFSKFGTYDDAVTGSDYQNTSPFVYLGFAPAFLMIKGTSAGREWVMYDKERKVYNPRYEYLRANSAGAEQTGDPTNHDLDFLSNGFKIRGGSGDINTTNESYIYMAFAENPFKYSNAR